MAEGVWGERKGAYEMSRAERGGDGGFNVLLGDAHGWRSGESPLSVSLSVPAERRQAKATSNLACAFLYQIIYAF
jgi:hypothetical protein